VAATPPPAVAATPPPAVAATPPPAVSAALPSLWRLRSIQMGSTLGLRRALGLEAGARVVAEVGPERARLRVGAIGRLLTASGASRFDSLRSRELGFGGRLAFQGVRTLAPVVSTELLASQLIWTVDGAPSTTTWTPVLAGRAGGVALLNPNLSVMAELYINQRLRQLETEAGTGARTVVPATTLGASLSLAYRPGPPAARRKKTGR
jgi:hypothetical protein